MKLFEPVTGSGVQLACDTASDSVLLGQASGEFQVSVYNASTDTVAYVDFGPSGLTITAATANPVPFGQVRGFTIKSADTQGAVYAYGITSTGTATIQVNRGHGI